MAPIARLAWATSFTAAQPRRKPQPTFRAAPAALLCCAALVLQYAGCSGPDKDLNRPKTVRATGVVYYQGQPVEGADVTFNNPTARLTGTAKTDRSGHFVLSTFKDKDGVAPGPQLVAIRRVDVIDKNPPGVDVSAGGPAVVPEFHWIIPEKYSDASKSGLTAEVSESGPNEFKFDLK